ncbi:hypothetical protein [Kribbella sandramycini]|uniref:Uncharacterized protein n=1 Tax=Kribbella sandramycini TaxID=60450 RepID=A0A841SCV6_9ACTN|nr:hypothetical protein [Kribbella sandramycini]MBB6567480.1 hypothetical protein [Kribbella sandramycini]
MPQITYLTDCHDGNARARLSTRIGALFGQSPTIIALDGPDPESFAALTLLDCLRATESLGQAAHPTITLLNLAPRDGHWPNGVPFGYFHYGSHLVATTFNPRALQLVRRELGVAKLHVTDIAEVLATTRLDDTEAQRITDTQFRSLWYLPLLAKWVLDGTPIPATPTAIPDTPEVGPIVTVVDNFGNCKLDRRPESIALDGVTRHPHLTAVPLQQAGLIPGSSGDGYAELVVRGGSAAEHFGLRQGDRLEAGFVADRTGAAAGVAGPVVAEHNNG